MATQSNLAIKLPTRLTSKLVSSSRTKQVDKGQQITASSQYQLLTNSARNYKSARNVTELIRYMAKAEGPISTATHNAVNIAESGHSITAYDQKTHQVSPEGTLTALSIARLLDTVNDYSKGYTDKDSLKSLKLMALREAALTGMVAGELGLNKARMPERLQLVRGETLEWYSDGNGGAYPAQKGSSGDPVPLNIPTFWVARMGADPGQLNAHSMLESAVKLIIYFQEFMEDIRRSVRVAGHNRVSATLDVEKLKEIAPQDVKSDAKQFASFLENARDGVQRIINDLDPEDAIVSFDYVTFETLESGTGKKIDYTPLLNVISGLYATSMKTPPSVLGLRLESGSQALGNVETLVFLKSVKALHAPVEQFFSRALTLACRLMGADVYVQFRFNELELRPGLETEAFRTMRDQRIYNRLSLGFISDDEAAVLLGAGPRSPGAPELSGTMFMQDHKVDADGLPTFPGDTAMGRTMKSDQPDKAGGASK